MPNLGAPELIIILVIVLLVFGGAKLPKLARSLGEAKNEFEKTAKPGAAGATPTSTEDKVTMSKAELDALLAKQAATSAAPATAPGEEKVTMTKAELDALLAQRDAAGKE